MLKNREHKKWWFALLGSAVLVLCVPTTLPPYTRLPDAYPSLNFNLIVSLFPIRTPSTPTRVHLSLNGTGRDVTSFMCFRYGFVPTWQPTSNFGRLYAVYGGFFVVMSYAWGWAFDGVRPDLGDYIGASIALAGVGIAFFWPRRQ